MSSLVLRFAGTQAWGAQATDDYRPSQRVPTRRGVLGFLMAARGTGIEDQRAYIEAASDWRILARADQPGEMFIDYQTVNPVEDMAVAQRWARNGWESGKNKNLMKKNLHPLRNLDGGAKTQTEAAISRRGYLAGAEFIIAIEAADDVISALCSDVSDPAFGWFLGRKNCIPKLPVVLGVAEGSAESTLAALASCNDGAVRVYDVAGDYNAERIVATHTGLPHLTSIEDWKTLCTFP